MKFSIKDFFSKCDQILQIWSHLLKKILKWKLHFWAVAEAVLYEREYGYETEWIWDMRHGYETE